MANILANIFGDSPVRPLEKHVEIVYECSKQLAPFFAAVVNEDWATAEKLHRAVNDFEHQADDLKKEIRKSLPKSLFMPVPREDLLELLLVQDRIANRSRDITSLVIGRRTKIPEAIADDFLDFVQRNIDAAKKARKSVRELDELFASGFRGAEAKLVEGLVDDLDRIETDTDNQGFALRGALFQIEKELDPIDAIFLYDVIRLTGDIADMAERVGRRLELLLAH